MRINEKIRIKPAVTTTIDCPYCRKKLFCKQLVWQGIHTCGVYTCQACHKFYISPLPIGHSSLFPFIIEQGTDNILGDHNHAYEWLAKPLQQSLLYPKKDAIIFKCIVRRKPPHPPPVIITNCIDYIYGHSLLKLFSVETFKHTNPKNYLVVIIPACLLWLVPEYVDEIWLIDIDIRKTQAYFLSLEKHILDNISRFKTVYLSTTPPHPSGVHISDFSKIKPFEGALSPSIAFYWRTDRTWNANHIVPIPLFVQYLKIIFLFLLIRKKCPKVRFSIVGVGRQYVFPKWIEDYRISNFNQTQEKELCKKYSSTNIIIGVLGSHMILPAAHAGATVEIVPHHMWGNMGQNIINSADQSSVDFRLRQFRHRFVPIDIRLHTLTTIILSILTDEQYSKQYFSAG